MLCPATYLVLREEILMLNGKEWSRRAACFMAALVVLAGSGAAALAANDDNTQYREIDYSKMKGKYGTRPCRILLMPNAQSRLSEVQSSLVELLGADGENGQVVRTIGKGQMTTFVIELKASKAQEIKKKIQADRKHFGAMQQSMGYRPTTILTGATPFKDPLAPFQKHLQTAGINQCVQKFGLSSANSIIIGITDTGISPNNRDLDKAKVIKRVDCTHEDDNGLPIELEVDFDLQGHGTAMAAVAAASTNRTLGASGGYKCKVVSERVMDTNGLILDEYLIDSLLYAGTHNIKVLNWSLNAPPPFTISRSYLLNPVLYLWMNWYATAPDSCRGLVINSSGNDDLRDDADRRYMPYLIEVAATNYDDTRCFFSNYGPRVDLSAPGRNILTSVADNNLALISGTSPAAAVVSGIVAACWSQKPSLTNMEMRAKILSTLRRPANFNKELGGGVINMQKLFEACK